MTNDPLTKATSLDAGDTIDVRVQVVDVKASDHKYFGLHDLVTFEIVSPSGDLPAGLPFHLRRPHDGSNDLRSSERKDRKARGAVPLPEANDKMTRDELLALADARGIDAGARPTKSALLKLLA